MRAGCVTTACTQGVSIGLTIFVPLYYEMVHGLSASDSGLALIPIVMMTTPGSYLSGRAMLYMDHYKWAPIVMLSIATAAVGLLVVHPLMPVWAVALITGLVGIGTGSSYPTVTVSIQNAVAHRPDRHSHGRDEFLPCARECFRRRADGGDHARRSRRFAAAGRGVIVGVHRHRGERVH